jgi:hypothetical protein
MKRVLKRSVRVAAEVAVDTAVAVVVVAAAIVEIAVAVAADAAAIVEIVGTAATAGSEPFLFSTSLCFDPPEKHNSKPGFSGSF